MEIDISGIDGLDLAEWESLLDSAGGGWDFSLRELISSLASGGGAIGGADVLDSLKHAALSSFREAFGAYAALIAVAVIANVIEIVASKREGVANAANMLCFSMAATLVAYSVTALITTTSAAVADIGRLVEAVSPVLATVLAACGSTGTGALMSPLTALLNLIVTNVFKGVVTPLISLASVTALIGVMSESVNFAELFAFLKSAVKWISGAVFTVYFGVVSIQGLTVARQDSIAIRTARYTLDKSVPVVGGAVSGSLDTILASASAVKNAAGAAVVITAVAAVGARLVNIACSSLAMKAVAAACGPLGEKRIPKLLTRLSEVCSMLFAALTAVTVMAMILAGLALAAGNP